MGPFAPSIDVSAGLLERIRSARGWDGISWSCGAAAVPGLGSDSMPGSWMYATLHEALVLVMEELEGQGFEVGQVRSAVGWVVEVLLARQEAVRSLFYDEQRGGVRRGVAGVGSVLRQEGLNYLLSRLDRGSLPGYYAEKSRMVDQGRVVAVGVVQAGVEEEEEEEEEKARAAAAAAKEEEAKEEAHLAAAAAAAAAAKEKEEEEALRRKQWILEQQMGWSDEDEDDGSDGGEQEIADWELWGSPEEIARKREEKAREEMPRGEKVVLIAREMGEAKAGVAKAKREGDKLALKGFGAVIGRLRREMVALGIDDTELVKVTGMESKDADGAEEAGVAVGDRVGGSEPRSPGSSSISEPAPMSPSSSSSSSAGEFCLDMFEQMGASEPAAARKINPAYAAVVQRLLNQEQQAVKGGANGKRNDARGKKHQSLARKHPKATLQQLAQREGWGAPRFERLPSGGERNPDGSSNIRFQALIDVRASSSRGKKSKTRLGIHRFVLPPELDGWGTATEAQDAISTLALMDLFGDPDLAERVEWELLKEPFDDFVMEVAAWEGDGQASTAKEDLSREREEFVTMVMSMSMPHLKIALSFDGNDELDVAMHGRMTMEEELLCAIGDKKVQLDQPEVAAKSEALAAAFHEWNESDAGKRWKSKRDLLPVTQIRDQLIRSLEVHDVVLVSGETGSGKTTQVPQMLLDSCLAMRRGGQCGIVCTQPRRIAAISVADRVSEERGEAGPGKKGSAVGYSVRFDSATNVTTRLEFCTTGILLRRLASDPALLKLSHVVVDEVHERTMQSDFLIAMLRDLVQKRRHAGLPLKVILMSATMNTEVISNYFAGCPVLCASGRTFPVRHLFLEDVYEVTGYVLDADSSASHRNYHSQRDSQKMLENSAGSKNKALIKSNWGDQTNDVILNPNVDADSLAALVESGDYSASTVRNLSRVNEARIDMDLVEHVVLYIHETQAPGAILVFVPGMGEIDNLSRRLMSQKCLQGHVVVPLHSSISPRDQKNAFKLYGDGVRKIVISTNIAETSVTIEDIVYVIDTGKHKERRHDATRAMSMLVEDSVSVANANQRKGRAGRVREGTCYALYTRQCYEKRMKKYQTPEIMRVPLEEMILQIHHLRLSNTADEFLSKVLQPPLKKAVEGAINSLIQAGALTNREDLTALGSHLAALPVDVNIGKILIMGALFQCLSPALSIAACLSHKSPFVSFQDKDDIKAARSPFLSKACDPKESAADAIAAGQQSDHLVLAAALKGWIDAKASGGMSLASKYAKKYNLSVLNINTIMDMRDQFAGMLESAGLAHRGTAGSGNGAAPGIRWYDDVSCPENAHMSSPEVIKAILVASLYPSIALIDEPAPSTAPTWHDGTGPVSIHPTSMLSDVSSGSLQSPFVVYSEKMKTSKVFLRDCSVASPLSIMLFGRQVDVDHRSSLVVVDGWMKLKVSGRCAAILMGVREQLDELLRSKIHGDRQAKSPDTKNQGADCLDIVTSLLKEEAFMRTWRS